MRDRRLDPERFRAIRLEEGLTQVQLAQRAGVSVSYIKYLEAGRTQPSLPYATVLASAMSCTVADFTEPVASDPSAA